MRGHYTSIMWFLRAEGGHRLSPFAGGCKIRRRTRFSTSRGGTSTVPLCGSCHAKAHGRPHADDWDISTLTSEALQRKQENGEKTGGDVPYGYELADDDSTLIENSRQQTVLDAVKQYRHEGLSYREIADRLEAEGFEPKGNRFHANTVRRIYQRSKRSD